nr:glycoside hydrolase family 95 protein [Clostridia bacterium]
MKKYNLLLKNPATEWENRTPIGSGALGAMIEGGIARESLQLNEERIWAGKKIELDSPDFRKKIDECRKLLVEGKAIEADSYAVANFASDFHRVKSYETAGELLLKLHSDDKCTDYRRNLSLNDGIASVTYTKDGAKYCREYFASYPARLIAVRLTSDKAPINIDASLFRNKLTYRVCGDTIEANGTPMIDGKPFGIKVKFANRGGEFSCTDNILKLRGAESCDIFISIVTDGNAEIPSDADYDKLKAEHIADFTDIMERSDITLPDSGIDAELPVNERLALMKQTGKADNKLAELYFQFGKY